MSLNGQSKRTMSSLCRRQPEDPAEFNEVGRRKLGEHALRDWGRGSVEIWRGIGDDWPAAGIGTNLV